MAKNFIIGGGGFIGSQIEKELIDLGDEVVIFDAFLNFVDPLKSNYSDAIKYRLNDLEDKTKIIRGDIRHKGGLLRAMKENKTDTVIHLAALPIANKSNEFPEEATTINIDGLINVLESFREIKDISRFVFASSSFVYGDFQYSPADEKHPTAPIDIYGGTKLAGEILTKAYSKKFGIEHTIIRPSAVYGPGDANRRVSQLFIQNAIDGKTLKLFNGGIEKVDFTYVTDTAHGFVLATKSEKAVNETFNITAGNGRSVKEFAEVIQKYIPNLELIETPTDMLRPNRGTISIEKAKKKLEYTPKIQIEEGIPKYIDFLKNKQSKKER